MDDDLYYGSDKPARGDNLFAWTVAILLLIGLAFAAWIMSFYVFGNPEKPFSYSILKKLGKLDPPKRFELTTAPRGEFLTAQQAYERFSGMPEIELQNQNDLFIRGYLRNYTDRSFKVPYIMGPFNIVDSYALGEDDRFPSGAIAIAQSMEFPAVMIEHIYPTEQTNVPTLQRMLVTGLDIRLRRTYDLSAVLRVTRLEDGRLLFTLVPLLYGSYAMGEATAMLRLEPPTDLNMESPLPFTSPERLQNAGAKYSQYRKNAGLPQLSTAAVPAPTPSSQSGATPQPSNLALVPVAPAVAASTPTPKPVAEATPVPVATPLPAGTPIAAATPVASPDAAATASPTPATTPAEVAASPSPGVPLQPFLATDDQPAQPSAAWQLYKPGTMPSGRLINHRDAAALADRGLGGQRVYLEGDFTVSVSDRTKAVLRPRDGSLFGQGAKTRIIAEFPEGTAPGEGTDVARGELRPFEIREVRRSPEGELNIFVREITEP